MGKTFRELNAERSWLLPPAGMDCVPPDRLAHPVREPVDFMAAPFAMPRADGAQ